MAFKQVGRGGGGEQATGDAIKVAKIEVGTVLEGYVVRLITKEENPEHANFTMKLTSTGEVKMIFTAGNLAFAAGKDGLIQEGLLTRITRLPDASGVSKAGKKFTRTQFKIEQDDEQTLDDANFEAIFKDNEEAPKSTVKSRAAALSAAASKQQ